MNLVRCTDMRKILRLDDLIFPGDDPVNVWDTRTVWWTLGTQAFCGMRPTNETGVAFLCRAGVVPESRGKGLQKRMIRKRVQWARAEGMTEVVTYTAPWNVASARSLQACGFKIYAPHVRWAGDWMVYWSKGLI